MKFKKATRYDEFAYAQQFAAETLIDLLVDFAPKSFTNVYEIGAGSGLLTKAFLSRFSCENLVLNDVYESEFMRKFYSQIGDISVIDIPKCQNIVLSSSVFQWISDLNVICDKIYSALEYSGICAFSTFIAGTLGELESFTHQGLKYLDEAQISEIFGRNFSILSCEKREFIAKFASLHELLNHLKQTGVNNLRGEFKLNKSTLKAMEAHFAGNFALSYNFVNLICRKEMK